MINIHEIPFLQESGLAKIVKKISKESSSSTIKQKAKDLVNGWYWLVYGLDTRYDGDGSHEEQYWKFKWQKLKEIESYDTEVKIGEGPKIP